MKYDGDFEYAATRVRSSFLWLPRVQRLTRVRDFWPGGGLELVDNDGETHKATLEEIPFRAPFLGGVNLRRKLQSVHLRRRPARAGYQQGIVSSQFSSYPLCSRRSSSGGAVFSHYLPEIEQAIRGDYPDLGVAFEMLQEGMQSISFGPNFGATELGEVVFRGTQVVGSLKNFDQLELQEGFGWLREHLESESKTNVETGD